MDQVVLPTKSGSLVLAPEDGWCRVLLRAGDQPDVELGADSTSVVVSRLAAVAAHPEKFPISGNHAGQAVAWVLSLAERHSSFYIHAQPDLTRIFIQDATGANTQILVLGPDELAAWRRLLLAKA